MKLLTYCILPAVYCLLLCSCERQEIPVSAHDAGDVITTAVNMDPTYKWQLYFDLSSNSVVGQNLKTTWDLGFETSAQGYHIVLNTSKAMFAWNIGNVDFAAVTDTIGFAVNRKWDESSGNFDSTAIGDWRTTGNVYIIDRGMDELGLHKGFRKIIVESVDAGKYSIRFANLDGSEETLFEVSKNENYNFSFFTFDNGGETLEVEPEKTKWDLSFTQYIHIFYDEVPVMPYIVTGCLINRSNTQAVMDSTISFEEITYEYAVAKTLKTSVNVIGYDWKTFVGDLYVTNTKMNYIIRDSEGVYYKLHFIDFYNQQGVKGNPKFEFQRL